MDSLRRPTPALAAAPARRAWLAALALVLLAARTRAQSAAGDGAGTAASSAASAPSTASAASAPPRLRFRTRRAPCACAGDIDDEAIERALAERAGRPASAPAGKREAKAVPNTHTNTPTPRRPTP
ncbi:MAG: hypothetical protein JNL85_16345 [Rubrivivax sp.]|nr:hypothetical protein [Rubrivivax sp.]